MKSFVNEIIRSYEKQNKVCFYCDDPLENLANKNQINESVSNNKHILICSVCNNLKYSLDNNEEVFLNNLEHWKNNKCKKSEIIEYSNYIKLKNKFKK